MLPLRLSLLIVALGLSAAPLRVAAGSQPTATGNWPGFRGPSASGRADGQRVPERWDATKHRNITWTVAIPGLAHSSPIVWGDRLFLTTAISSRAGRDASSRASTARARRPKIARRRSGCVLALDRNQRAYAVAADRVRRRPAREAAHQGDLRQRHAGDRRPLSSSPSSDRRGCTRSTSTASRCGSAISASSTPAPTTCRSTSGARPARRSSTATSYRAVRHAERVVRDGARRRQRQDGLEDRAQRAAVLGHADRLRRRQGGHAELVTNASNFVRGYDPDTGEERWRLGGSSKITAPTPVFADELIIVASGRRAGAADLRHPPWRPAATSRRPTDASRAVACRWSKTGAAPYMPTPLIYRRRSSTCWRNAGHASMPTISRPAREIYRAAPSAPGQRLQRVAGGVGRQDLPLERRRRHLRGAGRAASSTLLATNPMGEPLMATPAIAGSHLYVRGAQHLFAIGER